MHSATIWEALADVLGSAPALICNGRTTSWEEMDQRAARVAGFLDGLGLAPNTKLAIYMLNRSEFLEAQFAAFKQRICVINVNYRYKADELVYLLDNSDTEIVVFESRFADRIEEIRGKLPRIRAFIQVRDGDEPLLPGAVDYETLATTHAPAPRIERSDDDLYMIYTGGTTGMPKGVMYRMGDVAETHLMYYRLLFEAEPPATLAEAVEAALASHRHNAPVISIPAAPLMHGTGMWGGGMVPLSMGGTVITTPIMGFDAEGLLASIQRHRANLMVIVGDAFGRPFIRAIEDAARAGKPVDVSSVRIVLSSGAAWSPDVKQDFLEHMDALLVDALGSSETGMGSSVLRRGMGGSDGRFTPNPRLRVIDDEGREIAPGSGQVGKVAVHGRLPIGYYKDERKTAETFKTIGGVRYAVPGDFATVEENGQITFLGRGSACINSGGEKIFAEEVEAVVKAHPGVEDCLVVGVPDPVLGQRVVAVLAGAPGARPDDEAVTEFIKHRLAGYKAPKALLWVETIPRAPNGKPDYGWAKAEAEARLSPTIH